LKRWKLNPAKAILSIASKYIDFQYDTRRTFGDTREAAKSGKRGPAPKIQK